MKKLILISLLSGLLITNSWSGQDPLYTQFMTNPFIINPALTGTYPYYQIIANNRIQWVGFADAPITNTISMYGPMVSQPMGVGGYISHDVFGPESKTSICGTYGYNYSLAEDLKISMGLMLGMFQHKIGGDLNLYEDDKVFNENEVYQNFKPDASIGVYLYATQYHAGIAVTNLFGNKLKFEDDTTAQRTVIGRMKQHYYIHGGYKYFVNHELAIEPTLILRKVSAIPLQVDFNVRAWYGKRAWNGNKIWAGVTYRTKDAVNIMVGVIYQRKIEVGYSYDIGINKMRSFHTGSHELMVTFRFNNIKEY